MVAFTTAWDSCCVLPAIAPGSNPPSMTFADLAGFCSVAHAEKIKRIKSIEVLTVSATQLLQPR